MSRPSTEVRRAVAADLDGLADLMAKGRDEAGPSARALAAGSTGLLRARIVEALHAPGVTVLVALQDGELAGTVVLRRAPLLAVVDQPTLHVENLYVDQPYRRRGVGRALLAATVAAAERDGLEQIMVNVLPGARDANRILARLGFTPLMVRRIATTATVRRGLSGSGRRSGLEDLLTRRRSLRARNAIDPAEPTEAPEITPRDGIATRLRIEARRARRIDLTRSSAADGPRATELPAPIELPGQVQLSPSIVLPASIEPADVSTPVDVSGSH